MAKSRSIAKQMRLTQRQIEFTKQYIIDFNVHKAALRAGYSKSFAQFKAAQDLMENPKIMSLIAKETRRRGRRLQVTQDAVMDKFLSLINVNVQQFFNSDNTMKKVRELDKRSAYAIKKVKSKIVQSNDECVVVEQEFELHDKVSAAKEVAKMMGMYERHNIQKNKESGVTIYLPDNKRDDKTNLQLQRGDVTDIKPEDDERHEGPEKDDVDN